MKSFAQVRKVLLFLGRACNFRCRYCLQRNEANVRFSKGVSSETIELLQKIADAQPRKQRQQDSLRINLMGGEPLLYFPLIEDVVNRVNRTNVEWAFATNGSLLTPAMVHFFNEKAVKVILSHDGSRTKETRGVDVLKNPESRRCLMDLERLSVDSVVTAYSQDVYGVRNYVDEIFGRRIPMKQVFLTLLGPVPEDLLDYDLPAWQATCSRMGEAALEQFMSRESGWESDWYRRVINRYYDFAEGVNPLCNCSTRGKTLTIDGSGRVWRCINGVYPIGTVASECRELNQRSEENIIRLYQENKRFCGECRWFPFCHGHCPRETNTAQQTKQCEFMGIFFESVAQVMGRFEAFMQTQQGA